MSYQAEYFDEKRIFIPVKLLTRIHSQLRLNSGERSMDGISMHLEKYFNDAFKNNHTDLFHQFNALGIGYKSANVERAIKGKKGMQVANKNYEVSYELLDFLSYASWNKSLINVIFDKVLYWGSDTLYSVSIPDYIKTDLKKYLCNEKSSTSGKESIPQLKTEIKHNITSDKITLDVLPNEVIISMSGDFKEFKENAKYKEIISELTSKAFQLREVLFKSVKEGSIILTLEMDDEDTQKLIVAYKEGRLEKFGVFDIKVKKHTHNIKEKNESIGSQKKIAELNDKMVKGYIERLEYSRFEKLIILIFNFCKEFIHFPYFLFEKVIIYVYLLQNDIESAIKHYEKALKLMPGNTNIYESIAILYEKNNNIINAKEYYEKAIIVSPHNVKILTNFANFLEKNFNDKKRAIKLYEEALKIKPLYRPAVIGFSILFKEETNNILQKRIIVKQEDQFNTN
ncbi:MAG: tetratricopeptide repeat protein [Bacteroidales bacterium]|jgi:tetratricopeptide (TPR) repeat protein